MKIAREKTVQNSGWRTHWTVLDALTTVRGNYLRTHPKDKIGKIKVTLDFQATFILPKPVKVKCALQNRLYLEMVDAACNEDGGV